MKRWKALVLLGTLCLGLLLPWQAAAQEEPAGQLAEESGAAGVTEQLGCAVGAGTAGAVGDCAG